MELTTLKAELRTTMGTRVARAMRKAGRLPAVIYGHGEAPETISMSFAEVESSLVHGARTLSVEVRGKSQQYLIKAVQYDHLGDRPIHMDLARVDLDEKVKVRVGIELRGVPEGVSQGGLLDQHLADLEIECIVTEIPETLHPLVTHLGLGDSLLVKDLELPPGVTALASPEERVATVRAALEEATEDDEAEEGAGTAEPERIGRVRKDEEEDKGKGKGKDSKAG